MSTKTLSLLEPCILCNKSSFYFKRIINGVSFCIPCQVLLKNITFKEENMEINPGELNKHASICSVCKKTYVLVLEEGEERPNELDFVCIDCKIDKIEQKK